MPPIEYEISFQQGVDGYAGTVDTQLYEAQKNTSFATASQIGVDHGSGKDKQVLVQFDDLFGAGGIPAGATIVSATLTLQTTNGGNGATIHRMLTPWAATSTWNSLVNGVSLDGVEAVSAPEVSTGSQSVGSSAFDVTSSVQAWGDGTENYGWVFESLGKNGWDFYTSEGSVAPQLTVRYTLDGAPPVNTAPTAGDDTATVNQNDSVTIPVLDNDDDADGDQLNVASVTNASNGTVNINSDNTITYAPDPAFSGADSFTYTISDGNGGSDTASVNVSVDANPVMNTAPTAGDDAAAVNQNGSVIIPVLDNDVDADGDQLNVVATTSASNGTVNINSDNTITYTPDPTFSGADNFTYTVSDGNGGSDTASVNVAVNAPGQQYEISFQQGVDGYAGTVDTQLYEAQQNTSFATASQIGVDHGSGKDKQILVRFDDLFGAGGIPAGATIVSATLTLQTTNGGNGATIHRMLMPWAATSTWNSLVNGVSPDGVEAASSPEVSTGSQSVGSSAFDVTSSVQAWGDGTENHGWVFESLGTNGWDFYTSEGSVTPQLTVRYTLDGPPPVNTAPTAGDDAATVNQSGSVIIPVLDNDVDADGDQLNVVATTSASNGTVNINSDNTITYAPDPTFSGVDNFTYTISDGNGGSDTASVNVSVDANPVGNTAPTAGDDTATVNENGSVNISVLDNDDDADGDQLNVVATTNASNGTVNINSDNTITYTPDPTFSGADNFTYTISDGNGGSDTASVNVAVNAISPPSNSADSYVAIADGGGTKHNLEHNNSSKSFYHDGVWWAVLPSNGVWSVFEASGTPSSAGATGGWNIASDPLLNSNLHADIAWNAATNTLYVLQFGSNSSQPHLLEMSYDSNNRSWTADKDVNLSASLDSAVWGSNNDLSLGLDQNGNVLILGITGGNSNERGLHLAYSTSSDLSTWDHITVDNDTTSDGGGNGNSKADFIHFSVNGNDQVGIVYSKDGASSNSWSFAWRDSSQNSTDYSNGWSIETITTDVKIDDHLSVATDGEYIYAATKDNKDDIWLLKGQPGNWDDPVHVVDSGSPSRPIIAYDETSDQIYILYQEKTSPYGDIYMKATDAANPAFDLNGLGTVILEGTSSGDKFLDPQGPAHAVGSDTGNEFMIFAKNNGTSEIWYNDVDLASSLWLA